MLLDDLATTSERVSQTRSRLQKTQLLTDCLLRFEPDEIAVGTAYLAGTLPQGRLGIGPALLGRTLPANAAGSPSLSLLQVNRVFDRIAASTGPGSSDERGQLLGSLMRDSTRQEQRFLTRLLLGEVRQGALEGIMMEAISRAAQIPSSRVRRAAMLAGDLAVVARAALTGGEGGLDGFRLQILRPVKPMLAETAEDISDALTRLGDLALEFKLDGARVQIHKSGKDVAVFSRGLNDVTAAIPEVVEIVRQLPVRSAVLDGETIALRPDGRPHPFQVTMRRFGRKLDVDRMREKLPLFIYLFDCLHIDGEDLIDRPARERFEALDGSVPSDLRVPRLVAVRAEAAEEFLMRALQYGHEGVMAKALEAPYQAGSRGKSWLKIKPAQRLDLIVLAAEWGHGRRRGWLSNLHLGARDAESGQFVMLGKTFKGMTDEILNWQTIKLQEIEVNRDDYTVFVRPQLVVEVAFDEIQASRQYPGGLALRFARIKRYRPDKTAEEADTFQTVQRLYAHQSRRLEEIP